MISVFSSFQVSTTLVWLFTSFLTYSEMLFGGWDASKSCWWLIPDIHQEKISEFLLHVAHLFITSSAHTYAFNMNTFQVTINMSWVLITFEFICCMTLTKLFITEHIHITVLHNFGHSKLYLSFPYRIHVLVFCGCCCCCCCCVFLHLWTWLVNCT